MLCQVRKNLYHLPVSPLGLGNLTAKDAQKCSLICAQEEELGLLSI